MLVKLFLNTGPSYYRTVAKWAQAWYNLEIQCHFAPTLIVGDPALSARSSTLLKRLFSHFKCLDHIGIFFLFFNIILGYIHLY